MYCFFKVQELDGNLSMSGAVYEAPLKKVMGPGSTHCDVFWWMGRCDI